MPFLWSLAAFGGLAGFLATFVPLTSRRRWVQVAAVPVSLGLAAAVVVALIQAGGVR